MTSHSKSEISSLRTLIINSNKITKIQSIGESLPNLESLIMMNNQIKDLTEIDHLRSCKKLLRLTLLNNVVAVVSIPPIS